MEVVFSIKAKGKLKKLIQVVKAVRIKHAQIQGRCIAEMAGKKKDPKGDARERYNRVTAMLAGLRMYETRLKKLSRNMLCLWFASATPRTT